MIGRSLTHVDLPEDIPQFFVSEITLEQFSPRFQRAAERVLSSSIDPLSFETSRLLDRLARAAELPYDEALQLLAGVLPCFARQHQLPTLADYHTLLGESAEMAWIATEGNTFNHITERVQNIDLVAADQKALGRPMKPAIEISKSGRVRQTAYFADSVTREFSAAGGQSVTLSVPGSFYEFIERAPLPEAQSRNRLDLAFDSANAQGIFKMTAVA